MTLYITKNGQQLGPYSLEETQRFVSAGNLAITDLAWYEGLATWIPLAQVPGFAAQTPHGMPAYPEQAVRPERPVLVWIISIFYFALLFLETIGLVVMPFIARLPNLPDVSKDYFESLGVLYYGGQIVGIVVNLVAAILLLMLRRAALYVFVGAFILGILQMIEQIMNPSWREMASAVSFVLLTMGWMINIAILWYVWHLARTKVLR